jgi:hypothetical protein
MNTSKKNPGSNKRKVLQTCLYGVIVMVVGMMILPSDASAVALSKKSRITPFIEVREIFDDNIFLLQEDAPLEENQQSRDDQIFDFAAGVALELDVSRRLNVGFGYRFDYLTYVENDDQNQSIHALDLKADINPRSVVGSTLSFPEGIDEASSPKGPTGGRAPGSFLDRLNIKIRDNLSTVPIDTEEALLPGNKTFRNTFDIAPSFRIIAAKRTFLDVGYQYSRVDFTDETVDLRTAPLVDQTEQLTTNSFSNIFFLDFGYVVNPRLIFSVDYSVEPKDRPDPDPSEITDPRNRADIVRQHLLAGFNFKVTPRVLGSAKVGFESTSFDEVQFTDPDSGLVQTLSQDDQSIFAAGFSLTGSLSIRSTINISYDRHFTENDFGETLKTDDVRGKYGLRIGRRSQASFGVNYRREIRELTLTPEDTSGIASGEDENTAFGFDGSVEYRLAERIRTFGGYQIRNKQFFGEIFFDPSRDIREDTTQRFNVGLGYLITRYLSVNAEYEFVDNDSNLDEQDYNVNRFSIFGKASF